MPFAPPLTRLRWLKLNGQDALLVDFSHAKAAESLELIETFRQAMQGRQPGSVLLLTDVTKAEYEGSISTRWKAARAEFSPYIRASAIWGLSGLVGMAVRGLIDAMRLLGLTTDNHLRIFSTEAEATEWLAQQ
jgi:hypothetical protein